MNILSVLNEFVVMALVLMVLLITGWIIWKRLRKKRQRSSNATGIILSVEKIALAKEHQVEIKMLVMVMPERSRNFVGELIETVLLTDLLSMKIGDKIRVSYCHNYKLVWNKGN